MVHMLMVLVELLTPCRRCGEAMEPSWWTGKSKAPKKCPRIELKARRGIGVALEVALWCAPTNLGSTGFGFVRYGELLENHLLEHHLIGVMQSFKCLHEFDLRCST